MIDSRLLIPINRTRTTKSIHKDTFIGESVVKYLARYVGRTAISDERIVTMTDEAATFRYTDTKGHSRDRAWLLPK